MIYNEHQDYLSGNEITMNTSFVMKTRYIASANTLSIIPRAGILTARILLPQPLARILTEDLHDSKQRNL